MLEYIKTILQKVSFDQQLFEKELKKSRKYLISNELKDLKEWCYQSFGHIYKKILDSFFGFLRPDFR